ncbi:hypothetical protein GCM10011366_02540 [Ornithinimicrobium tianjinense]|uniref:Uncharacterized protein n=1 Tax=Ornithinimicrobium tianjinense TaxID=1195761 RepID=A0A917BFL5_9MICO|nr:hypothetical protein GCM10011366_02540 [Ornithinimicrobium tianjinense]
MGPGDTPSDTGSGAHVRARAGRDRRVDGTDRWVTSAVPVPRHIGALGAIRTRDTRFRRATGVEEDRTASGNFRVVTGLRWCAIVTAGGAVRPAGHH